jgi:superfamily II DNA or RNA helicase
MPAGIHTGLKCKAKPMKKFVPAPHQLAVAKQLIENPDQKGILCIHKLGSGKTCTSILSADGLLMADAVKDKKKFKHVYVFSPGALRSNFIEEYCKKCGHAPENIKNYTFITYNYHVGENIPNLDNSVIVIDEAHNFINGVKNASKTYRAMWDRITKAKNVKIIALTATPIYNNVYEIMILLEMLKPGAFGSILTDDGVVENASEIVDALFIVRDGKRLPVPELRNALKGLISYVEAFSPHLFPKVINEPIEKLVMTPEQTIKAIDADRKEIIMSHPPSMIMKRKNPARYAFLKQMFTMAKKNVISRQPSNFIYPETIEKARADSKDNISDQLHPNGWVRNIFTNVMMRDKYSPKFYALLTKIKDNFDSKHMIFSFFKEKSGVVLLSALLNRCGVKTLLYTGDTRDREDALRRFNSENNKYGDDIKVILVTDAGAEGITLLEVQHVHILESDRRENKIKQVIGRAVRMNSHARLPAKKRFVHVHRYWSVYPKDKPETIKGTLYDDEGNAYEGEIKVDADRKAIDEILYKQGKERLEYIDSVIEILASESIESRGL